jgi:hypothetical protein
MGNLPALLPNATPMVIKFAQKYQKNINFKAIVLLLTLKKVFYFGLRTFPVIVSNNYARINGKMGFTIEDKTLIINNELIFNRLVGNQ